MNHRKSEGTTGGGRTHQERDGGWTEVVNMHCTLSRSDTQNICQLTAGVDILAMRDSSGTQTHSQTAAAGSS